MTVTVYSKPNCVACTQTKKNLEKSGITYNTIDITEDTDAYNKIVDLGFRAAPVVIVNRDGQEDAWAGYQPEKLLALI